MDFAYSDDQEALRASAREWLTDRYPIERVAAIADGDGFPRDEWRQVAELGWTGISVHEDQGGAGLGFLEELIVAEEMGRALYPGPYFSCVMLGLEALRWGGARELIPDVVSGKRIVTLAWAGEDGRFDTDPPPKVTWDEPNRAITATKLFVPDLEVADVVLVAGGIEGRTAIWILADPNGDGVRRKAMPAVDATRQLGELVLEGAPADEMALAQPRSLDGLRDRALAALAAEAVGVASRAIELALEHARTRQQFGRPIGAFQAVSHQLAQAFLEVETARSLAYWAGWAVAEGAHEAPVAAATGKARAAEAAVVACERAIQVHGGIGFTWEHPLHRYYKRALGISAMFGWGPELRSRVAAALLD